MSDTIPEGITRCWQNNGYHVYAAGPCFDTLDQAVAYKVELDSRGITWKSQDESWIAFDVRTGGHPR